MASGSEPLSLRDSLASGLLPSDGDSRDFEVTKGFQRRRFYEQVFPYGLGETSCHPLLIVLGMGEISEDLSDLGALS